MPDDVEEQEGTDPTELKIDSQGFDGDGVPDSVRRTGKVQTQLIRDDAKDSDVTDSTGITSKQQEGTDPN